MEISLQYSSKIVLVVPCYNESKRWNTEYWNNLSQLDDLTLVFVNDGSTDDTYVKMQSLLVNSTHHAINLDRNFGKAEAIRQGFAYAFQLNPKVVGFLDADGAFTFQEVARQVDIYMAKNSRASEGTAIWSSRVQLSGRKISRDVSRHYLARILITCISVRFGFSIYDPQSGYKLYPNSVELQQCFSYGFCTRWFVDLEVYLRWRLVTGQWMKVWEEPVLEWKDVKGSKVSGREYFRICRDILRLVTRY